MLVGTPREPPNHPNDNSKHVQTCHGQVQDTDDTIRHTTYGQRWGSDPDRAKATCLPSAPHCPHLVSPKELQVATGTGDMPSSCPLS